MNMTNWKDLISYALEKNQESWDDVISHTLTPDQLIQPFDDGYGIPEGPPFTLWTIHRVYFPVTYDGAEWVGCVPRNPNSVATYHIGGC